MNIGPFQGIKYLTGISLAFSNHAALDMARVEERKDSVIILYGCWLRF